MPDHRIFMGNGDHSMAKAYDLHIKLAKALSDISTLQQAGPYIDQDTKDDLEGSIWFTTREIYMKLTGKVLPISRPK